MGYDFETDKKYNIEKYVSMTIQLNKTCYSPGEYLNGTIILKPKEGLQKPLLQDTNATLYLTEFFYYKYFEEEFDHVQKRKKNVSKVAEESIPLITLPMNFSNFYNANIINTVNIPFQIQIPMNCYPSCIFDSTTYVKHYLAIDFPSIMAKKTEIIVIKNNSYFSKYNGLLQEPAICYKETTKRKLFISQGSFNATLKLPRNLFTYDEMIPFEVDVDATKLSIDIKAIRISINRNQKRNYQRNHNEARGQNKKECVTKTIPLPKGQKKHHIEDVIQLKPEVNPKDTYKLLDTDKRKYSEKYDGIRLSPSCYGGLLSCEYYIKMVLEMDTMLSTDEDIRIPIDLYEPFMPCLVMHLIHNIPNNLIHKLNLHTLNNNHIPHSSHIPNNLLNNHIHHNNNHILKHNILHNNSLLNSHILNHNILHNNNLLKYPQPQYPPQQQPPQQPYPQPQYPPQQQPPQQPYPQPQYPPQQPYPQQQYPSQIPPQTIPASIPQNADPNNQGPNLPSQAEVYNNNYQKPSEPPSNQINSYPSFDNSNNNAAPPTLNQMLSGK